MPKKTTTSRKSKKGYPQAPKLIFKAIPKARRLDIFGIFLVLVGVITLLSLFDKTSGSFTNWWVKILSQAVGVGVYVLPLILIISGVWLLLRHFNKMPHPSLERSFGITLLFINLLAWAHLFIHGDFVAAEAGKGGGYVGAAFYVAFVRTLGDVGALIVLIAWLLISLILLFDLSMADIANGISKVFARIFRHIKKAIQDRQRARQAQAHMHSTMPMRVPGAPVTHGAGNQPKAMPETPLQPVNPVTAPVVPPPEQQPAAEVIEPHWELPDPDLILEPGVPATQDEAYDQQRGRVIEETLRSFGAPGHIVEVRRGPTITLFGVEPDFVESSKGRTRVRVSKITALVDDLALALAASRIRIQAPVPGKGYIGIEVPNREVALVTLKDLLFDDSFKKLKTSLAMGLGKDVSGNPTSYDLTGMPHLLIAGTTGSGKSVCVNAILSCLLLFNTPETLRLILVDPKRVELTGYNGIPHLLSPVIVEAENVVGALQWVTREMDTRYKQFADARVRNIIEYNNQQKQKNAKILPYMVVVIDELADLMMLAPDETERTITRLAQLARATGIHLILATQRPSADIITGLIKANFPARIAFAVASNTDSRVILDQPGAERLLGRGDMLFVAPDAPAPVRLQGAFVSEAEINRLVTYWRQFLITQHAPERPEMSAAFAAQPHVPLIQKPLWEEMKEANEDPKVKEAIALVRQEGRASTSMLQRKMGVGYTRAARIIELLAERGIVGQPDPHTGFREVLDMGEDAEAA